MAHHIFHRPLVTGKKLYQKLADEYQWYTLYAAPYEGGDLIDISGNGRDIPITGTPAIDENPVKYGQGYDALAADFNATLTYADGPMDGPLGLVGGDRLTFIVSHERFSTGNAGRYMELRGSNRVLMYSPDVASFGIFDGTVTSTAYYPIGDELYLLGAVHEPAGGNNELWINGHLVKTVVAPNDEQFNVGTPDLAVGADTQAAGRTGGTYNLAGILAKGAPNQAGLGGLMSQIMLGQGKTNYYWDKVHTHRANLHCYLPCNDPAGTIVLDGSGQENYGTASSFSSDAPNNDKFVSSINLGSTENISIPARDWTGSSWTAFGYTTYQSSTSRAGGSINPSRTTPSGEIAFFPVGGRMNFRWYDGTSTITINTGTGVSVGQSVFWTIRYDFGADEISVFVDGGNKDSASVASLTMPDLSSEPMIINETFGLAGGFPLLNGIGVVNTALTDEEIAALV